MPDRLKALFASIIFSVTVSIPVAWAQNPIAKALTFSAWKDQQVLDAQNQVLRASARLSQLKAGKATRTATDAADLSLSSNKLKKVADSEALNSAESDVRQAQETLESASKLQFSDYVEVYIPSLADQPDALQKLSEKLTKDELTEIFKALMHKSNPDNASRNTALMDGLTVSARTKPQ